MRFLDITFETVVDNESGSIVKLPISSDGYSLCPVCGSKARNREFRPYYEGGYPSYGICDCGIEFGFDCSVDSLEKDWAVYRQKRLNEELKFGSSQTMQKKDKIQQLKSIGIDASVY